MKTKIQKRAETKKTDREEPKEYRVSTSENGSTHQITFSIEQKITWKSEVGKREEWITVRNWAIGKKAGHQLRQILKNIKEAEQGKTLSPEIPYTPQETNHWHNEDIEDTEDTEEEIEEY